MKEFWELFFFLTGDVFFGEGSEFEYFGVDSCFLGVRVLVLFDFFIYFFCNIFYKLFSNNFQLRLKYKTSSVNLEFLFLISISI